MNIDPHIEKIFNEVHGDRKAFLIRMIQEEFKETYGESVKWAERASRMESIGRYWRHLSPEEHKDRSKEDKMRQEYSKAEQGRRYVLDLQKKAQEALIAKDPNLQLL